LLPQSPQNLFRVGFAAPQAGQRRAAAAPHCPQYFLCAGTSAAQFVQCIRTSGDIHNADTMRQTFSDRYDLGHNFDPPRCSRYRSQAEASAWC
jgi:hypothetical protein